MGFKELEEVMKDSLVVISALKEETIKTRRTLTMVNIINIFTLIALIVFIIVG